MFTDKILSKYLGIWVLNEGSSVLCGIGYNGKTAEGTIKWDGLSNVKPLQYETGATLNDIVGSFNINTNDWAKRYVFKRLKFVGNKSINKINFHLLCKIFHSLQLPCSWHFGMELPLVISYALPLNSLRLKLRESSPNYSNHSTRLPLLTLFWEF